jgi:uncharacterized protein YhfF
LTKSARQLWDEYCRVEGLPADTPLPPVWHFCDNEAEADECARLVLAGRKRATAPSLWELEHRGEAVPRVGMFDVITAWNGEARAIIRTSRVDIVAFSQVGAEHAAAEGEGDGSLEWWRRIHREYYARVLTDSGCVPTDDMPLVCQYFDVVFPRD